LVAGCHPSTENSEIRVWDLEAETVRVLEGSKGMVFCSLEFSKSGSLLSGDRKGNVLRWNIQDGQNTLIAKGRLPEVISLAITRDESRLFAVFASTDFTRSELIEYDLKDNTSRAIKTHGSCPLEVTLDPTETLLLSVDDEGVIRVGSISGDEPHMLLGPREAFCLSVSPDGRWIGSLSCLWRMPEGRPIQTLPHDAFLSRLRALTNVRVFADKASQTGYRLDKVPFPGWDKVPAW
jgi:WD40 repeat protein